MPKAIPEKIRVFKSPRVAEIVVDERRERVESIDFPALGDLRVIANSGMPVAGFVFGTPCGSAVPALDSPFTWLDGGTATRLHEPRAAQIFSIADAPCEPVSLDGVDVGFAYEDINASYCRLRGIVTDDPSLSRGGQTTRTFERVKRALESAGFAFADVVRTWCYLDGLLDWYGEFNAARNAFFEKEGVCDGVVPASTGIGAANASGSALVVDVLAIRPRNGAVDIHAVESPMQNPALDYKSSFSRAVEVEFPEHTTLFISGTASIDGEGRSVRIADLEGQIELTLDVVEALLDSRGMSWSDAFRGIAYFKNAEDMGALEPITLRRRIPKFPLISVPAAVCRDELLFEIELDAVKA